jgi:Na+-driven multidrug efflux pump
MMGAFFREPHIVDLGTMIMHIMIFVTFFQISQVVYMGSLRAAGDTRFTAAAGAFSVLGVRVGVGYLCAYVLGLGLRGIWFGILGDQMSRFLLSWLRFRAGKWTKIRI